MSDYQVDAGWWQASDGRWYPPEQRPGYSSEHEKVSALPGGSPLAGGGPLPGGLSADPADPLLAPRPNPRAYFDETLARVAASNAPVPEVTVSQRRSVFEEPGLSPLTRGWEFDWGRGVIKGLRTRRQPTTYLVWAMVLFVFYATFTALVATDRNSMGWIFLSLPGLIAFGLVPVYRRIWDYRTAPTKGVPDPHRDSASDKTVFRWAAYVAAAAFVVGAAGNLVYWGAKAVQLYPSNNGCSVVELHNPQTGLPIVASGTSAPNPSCGK